jgi:hypothetical protein
MLIGRNLEPLVRFCAAWFIVSVIATVLYSRFRIWVRERDVMNSFLDEDAIAHQE